MENYIKYLILTCFTILWSIFVEYNFGLSKFICFLIGFSVIFNYIFKLKKNSFFIVKSKYILKSRYIYNKVNDLCSHLSPIFGFTYTLSSFLVNKNLFLLITISSVYLYFIILVLFAYMNWRFYILEK